MLGVGLLLSATAFVPPLAPLQQRSQMHLAMMAKGFGKTTTPPPPPPKKTAKRMPPRGAPPAQLSDEAKKAGADFDALKSTGAPEYTVAVRTVDAAGAKSEWYLVGGIAVPRSSSEDTAVSMAIFQNEDELLKGAYKFYPKLKMSTDKFEYGYKLRDFPDDPWSTASVDATKQSTNPLMQWFNQLDSPLNKD
jgi:hypothetical protein